MDELNLRQLLKPLIKWWWLIAASLLLAGVSSGLYTLRQPPTYISRTTIMVGSSLLEPNPRSSDLFLASQLASAYVDIVQRSTIRLATQTALGLTRLPYYTARLVPNTQLIEVSVVDIDPTRAQAVAAELVNQLLRTGPGTQDTPEYQTFIEEQLTQMEDGIKQTTAEIERIKTELTEMFSARQIRDAREQITALELKLATLQANYANLIANSRRGATNTIHVLDPADLPTAPMTRDLVMNVLVAMALGFALSATTAYFMHYLDNTLQGKEDIEEHLALPTLGLMPKRRRANDGFAGLDPGAKGDTTMSDAYSGLRLNIQAAMAGAVPKTLLVGSPMIGDGKSSVVANLAVEYVHAGYSVLVIDADLRQPSLHRLFNLHNQSGFSTLLLGDEQEPDTLIQHPPLKGLSILTSGPLPPNPTHLLSRNTVTTVLKRFTRQYDIVLLDTPPFAATVDASILATQVEAILLVIAIGRTKRTPSTHVVDNLRHLRANLLGVALNYVPVSQTAYGSTYGYLLSDVKNTGNTRSIVPPLYTNGEVAGANSSLPINGSAKRNANPLLPLSRKR